MLFVLHINVSNYWFGYLIFWNNNIYLHFDSFKSFIEFQDFLFLALSCVVNKTIDSLTFSGWLAATWLSSQGEQTAAWHGSKRLPVTWRKVASVQLYWRLYSFIRRSLDLVKNITFETKFWTISQFISLASSFIFVYITWN